MPVFSYKGRNNRGDLVHGRLESPTSSAVADQLFNTGIIPIDISLAGDVLPSSFAAWWSRVFPDRVGLVELMLFSRQMYTLLKAGVPILRALAGLQESTQSRAMAETLRDVRESLDTGRELSVALRRKEKVFSQFYISMIQVGEVTGRLEEVFLRLFHHIEFEKDMRERVKAAIRYPLIVLLTMALALVIINIFVIPAFAKVFKGFHAELPLMTRVLIGFSDFMVQFWPLLLALLAVAVIGFQFYVKTRDGKYNWDKLKLRLPIAGKIILKATLARFARSFALASRSGVPLVQGLSNSAQVVDNDYIGQRIEQMRDGVERGESILRTAVVTGIFTPVVLQMIAVGEETGELDDLMSEVADMYEREVDYEIKTLSAQIEPIMLVGLGAMVLVLALGVFLPLWDLGRVAIK